MNLQLKPLFEVTSKHAGFAVSPLAFVADTATQQLMTSLQLKTAPNVIAGSLAVYFMTTSTGVTPILKANEDTVLTFMILARDASLDIMTQMPETDLIRCFSTAVTTLNARALQLDPPTGTGVAQNRKLQDVDLSGATGVVQVVRAVSEEVVAEFIIGSGVSGAVDLPIGRYDLRQKNKTLKSVVLLGSSGASPFGILEIALCATSIPPAERILQGQTIQPQRYDVSLPARRGHIRYAITGLRDADATIVSNGTQLTFPPMERISLNGQTGFETTSCEAVPLAADGSLSFSVQYSDGEAQVIKALPRPTNGGVGVENAKDGQVWICSMYFSL